VFLKPLFLGTQLELVFHCCCKIPEINNLREKGFTLTHGFRSFSPLLAGSIALRPMATQKQYGRQAQQKKIAHLTAAGSS
jgi:hypothetical protein